MQRPAPVPTNRQGGHTSELPADHRLAVDPSTRLDGGSRPPSTPRVLGSPLGRVQRRPNYAHILPTLRVRSSDLA